MQPHLILHSISQVTPPEDDLLMEGDKRASPALSRSPLLTNNRLDLGGEAGAQASPYASRERLPLEDPMANRGGGMAGAAQKLVVK